MNLKKVLSKFLISIWQAKSGKAAAIQTLISRILILAINVATGVITARTLGPDGRGIQATIILWPQFIAQMLTLGLPSALIYNFKRYPQEKSALFTAVLTLGTGLGCLATSIGIIFLPYWLSQYSPKVIIIAQLFMLFAPASLLTLIFMSALEARSEFTIANQLRYLSPLFTVVSLIILALLGKLTPLTAGLSYLLPLVPMLVWSLIYLWQKFQPCWQGLGKAYKRLLSYGLRSYGVDLIGVFSMYLGQALVVGMLSSEIMGMYTVALSISRMLNVIQSSIVVVLLPKTAAKPKDEVVDLTTKAARISIFLASLGALGGIILGPILLKLLYGAEFLQATLVLRILLVDITVNSTTWIYAQAFMALGKPGIVTILQCVGLGLSWPLMLLLIPQYGMEGAGLALLLSSIVRLIFILACYPFVLKVKLPGLLMHKEDFRFMLQALPIDLKS